MESTQRQQYIFWGLENEENENNFDTDSQSDFSHGNIALTIFDITESECLEARGAKAIVTVPETL